MPARRRAKPPAKAATPFATYPLVGAREEVRLRAFGRPAARTLPAETLPVLVARHAATDAGYRPPAFPVTREHLRAEFLGEPFIDYFATNWPQLVSP